MKDKDFKRVVFWQSFENICFNVCLGFSRYVPIFEISFMFWTLTIQRRTQGETRPGKKKDWLKLYCKASLIFGLLYMVGCFTLSNIDPAEEPVLLNVWEGFLLMAPIFNFFVVLFVSDAKGYFLPVKY